MKFRLVAKLMAACNVDILQFDAAWSAPGQIAPVSQAFGFEVCVSVAASVRVSVVVVNKDK